MRVIMNGIPVTVTSSSEGSLGTGSMGASLIWLGAGLGRACNSSQLCVASPQLRPNPDIGPHRHFELNGLAG